MKRKQMLHTRLPIEKLMPHPKNVRRDVGDVTELAASIAAQGIMQNLLVVPAPGHEDSCDLFWVVIGNRRLAAARMAEIEKLPCTVAEGLSDQEQLELMLVENLQRRDLTPQEEAEAYEQLTLDFGLSAEQIAEKTGVSASTIRRRLKIKDLDQGEIEKKDFQLSISDYSALEKVKSKELRNKVLRDAKDSLNLHYLADRMHKEEEVEEQFQAQRQVILDFYDGKVVGNKTPAFVFIDTINLSDPAETVRRRLRAHQIAHYPEIYIFHYEGSCCFSVYGLPENPVPGQTEEDRAKLREQKRDRDHRFILKKSREMAEDRQTFIAGVINRQYKLPENITEQDAQTRLWCILRGVGSLLTDLTTLTAYWTHSDRHMVFDADKEIMAEQPAWIQMLAAAGQAMDRSDFLCSYGGKYRQEAGENMTFLINFLKTMGFSLRDQEQQSIIEGTHDAWEVDL